MENLCIASALPGTVSCSVLETWVMEKTMISERLLPWFICSSFSLQFYASTVKERSLYLKLFVQSKSGDSGITADNGTDNYDRTKHPGAENNYFPEEEQMHDGEDEDEVEDEDEDEDYGSGEQGSSDSEDNDQDDDDDSSDCNEDTCDENEDCEEEEEDCDDTTSEEGNDDESLKMNTVEGESKVIGKRNRAETSRGEEREASPMHPQFQTQSEARDGQSESHGRLVELLRGVEALEALELQLSQKCDDFNRHYNDFRPKFKDTLDILLRRRDAICTYAEIMNGELRRLDPTTMTPAFEISMPDMNLACLGDVPPHTRPHPHLHPHPHPHPPQVQRQGEGEAVQEKNDANTNTRGLTIEGQQARVQVLGLRMIESLQLVQENARWLDNVQGMMDAFEKWMNSTSTLFSTKSNDLKRRGYNIPLWKDAFIMPSTSEVPNAVKDYASPPTSPPIPANNPPSPS